MGIVSLVVFIIMAQKGLFLLLLLGISSIDITESTNISAAGCGDDVVRGVNLGGWLVLEPWITPRFFEQVNVGQNLDKIVDEWTHAQYLDSDTYMERMVAHWDTFVTEDDFATLAGAGVSHVRVPIAYWYWSVEEGEPFPTPNTNNDDPKNPLFFLRRALSWMDKYGLKASMDLHTGPGSQNGYDNSGRRGEIRWATGDYPQERANIDRTLVILDMVCTSLSSWVSEGLISLSTIYGIGILNEPHICGPWYDEPLYGPACMQDFYPKAYDVVRKHFSPEDVKVVVDIAARGFSAFENFMPDHRNDIDLDAHHYQCFGESNFWSELPEGWTWHLEEACRMREDIEGSPLNTWSGEFSLAITDCQKYLQGGFVTPYVPPQSSEETCNYYNSDFSTFAAEYKQFLTNFFLAQLDSFEAGAGWTMWTMKTEENCAPEWDFLFLLEQGILPQDLCNRPTFCS